MDNATNNSGSTEKQGKRVKKQIDFTDTLFEVEQDTIDAIQTRIESHHEATGTGLPCEELAIEFCGDKKFRELIVYVVDKYLSEAVESVQGVGYCVKGKERLKGADAPPAPVEPERMEEVRLFAESLLNKGMKNLSLKALTLQAALQGKLHDKNGNLDSDEFENAIRALCATDERYEIAQGSGFRKRGVPPVRDAAASTTAAA